MRTASILLALSCAMFMSGASRGQAPASQPAASKATELVQQRIESYRLWSGPAPRAQGELDDETPTLTVLRPQGGRTNGSAIVIAPGGAYIGLAGMLEGVEPAAWFTARGTTAFVLTYRVGPKARLPIPLLDGARAIRFVRANAKDFGVDPSRIGMMGFSAGGHLAATTAVNATAGEPNSPDPIERVSSRPDFLVLVYPWLEGMQVRTDGTSSYCDFANRRGGEPSCQPQDYTQYLPLARVTKSMPPTFLFHTTDDELVPVLGTIRFYEALVNNGVSAELHAFATGPHGVGLGSRSSALSHWPELLDEWLRARQLLSETVDEKPSE